MLERKEKKSMDFSPCSIISKSVNDKASSIGLVRKPKCHANNSNIQQQNNLSSRNEQNLLLFQTNFLGIRTRNFWRVVNHNKVVEKVLIPKHQIELYRENIN